MRQNGQNKFLTVAGPQIYWNLCQYNLAQFARSGCIPRFQDLLDERTKDPSQVDNTHNTCYTWGCLASRWWKAGTADPWHFHTLTHSTWDCYLSTPESNKKSNDPLLETRDSRLPRQHQHVSVNIGHRSLHYGQCNCYCCYLLKML